MTDERYKKLMADLGMPDSQSLYVALHQVANEVGQKYVADVEEQKQLADDLVYLISRLVQALRKASPDHDLARLSTDYLKRKGLCGSPLREQLAAAERENSALLSLNKDLLTINQERTCDAMKAQTLLAAAEKDAARYRAKRHRDFANSPANSEEAFNESYDSTCDFMIAAMKGEEA